MNLSRLQTLADHYGLHVEADLAEKASFILSQAVGEDTCECYAYRFGIFQAWCEENRALWFPARDADVARFFMAIPPQYGATSLRLIRTAIKMQHLRAGFTDPTTSPCVRAAIEERLRTLGTARPSPVLYFEDFLHVVHCIGTASVRALRDRAIFLCAYLGALHCRDLIKMRAERIIPTSEGLDLYFHRANRPVIQLRRLAQVRFCPVAALQAYKCLADITHGPIFVRCDAKGAIGPNPLYPNTFNLIIAERCMNAGLAHAEQYTTRSLFGGFLVTGHEAGLRTNELMVRSGLRFNAVERYKKFARSKSPLPGAYVGF